MSDSLVLRPAVLADLPALAELFAAYRAFYRQPLDLPVATRFLSARMAHQQSVILVAENSAARLLGFCQIYPGFCSILAAPIGVLYDLFVAPQARRSGTGRALLLAAQAAAHTHGWQRLDLTTAHDNLPAQRLYESLGWQADTLFRAYNKSVPARSET